MPVFNTMSLNARSLGAHQGGHATIRFLEGFFEGSFKEELLRRVFKRALVRVSEENEVLRRVLRRGGLYRRLLEGMWQSMTHSACTLPTLSAFKDVVVSEPRSSTPPDTRSFARNTGKWPFLRAKNVP